MVPSQPSEDQIADDEILYRAVRGGFREIVLDAQGKTRIGSNAFNDARRRPSVDRAKFCPGGPTETRERFSPGSGVLSLSAQEARTITTKHGTTGLIYGVDIEPAPLESNLSHAEIVGRPPFDTDKIFDRIKQALARIAAVALLPEELKTAESNDPDSAERSD